VLRSEFTDWPRRQQRGYTLLFQVLVVLLDESEEIESSNMMILAFLARTAAYSILGLGSWGLGFLGLLAIDK
jgi:hypothetical protein